MKKQTALEWLVDQCNNWSGICNGEFIDPEIVDKAKAMEKEQIEEAYSEGKFDQYYYTTKEAEQYYNETYNKTS